MTGPDRADLARRLTAALRLAAPPIAIRFASATADFVNRVESTAALDEAMANYAARDAARFRQ